MTRRAYICLFTSLFLPACQGPQTTSDSGASSEDLKFQITAEYKVLSGVELARVLAIPDIPNLQSRLYAVGYLQNQSYCAAAIRCQIECFYTVVPSSGRSYRGEAIACIPCDHVGGNWKATTPFVAEFGGLADSNIRDMSTMTTRFVVREVSVCK